jgi:hypothetical protein
MGCQPGERPALFHANILEETNMIELSTILKPRGDVRYRIVDREAVVVQQQDARVMGLNETGAYILAALDGKRTVRDILAVMPQEYEVSPETLQADTLRYLDELLSANVIEPVNADH